MEQYAPQWGDLAPRDVVARAIHHEMIAHGYPHVLLDLASQMAPQTDPPSAFPPSMPRACRHGVDITTEPIPVVPAAHYFCGGVLVDAGDAAASSGLYAVGEVSPAPACTAPTGWPAPRCWRGWCGATAPDATLPRGRMRAASNGVGR